MATNDVPEPAPSRPSSTDPAGSSRQGAGDLEVACRVSGRSLRFVRGPQFDVLAQDDLLRLDIMTVDRSGAPYKLCELTVSRAELLRGIAAAGEPPHLRGRAGPARNLPPS